MNASKYVSARQGKSRKSSLRTRRRSAAKSTSTGSFNASSCLFSSWLESLGATVGGMVAETKISPVIVGDIHSFLSKDAISLAVGSIAHWMIGESDHRSEFKS